MGQRHKPGRADRIRGKNWVIKHVASDELLNSLFPVTKPSDNERPAAKSEDEKRRINKEGPGVKGEKG